MISKSLESSVKYPKKILGIHNVPKRPKRIQKDPKSMFLHVSINLFHEAEPSNWTLSVMVSGSLRSRIVPISINPPDVGPSTSCKIVRPWFCSKNYVEETHCNMVSIRFWPMPNWIELPFCWNSAITGPLCCWERSVFESYDAALDSTDKGELGWDDWHAFSPLACLQASLKILNPSISRTPTCYHIWTKAWKIHMQQQDAGKPILTLFLHWKDDSYCCILYDMIIQICKWKKSITST